MYVYVSVSVYVYVSWVFQTFSPFSCGFNGHKYTQHTAIAESRPFSTERWRQARVSWGIPCLNGYLMIS